MKRLQWIELTFAIGFIILASGIALSVYSTYQRDKIVAHTPKFLMGQCFTKQGLREPWDLDVAGKVVLRGYNKYLVMFTSEAERTTLTKWGVEQDIIEFDNKYQVAPCPLAWKEHTSEKNNQRHKE